MGTIGVNNFGPLDYAIVGFTLAASLGIGLWPALKARGRQTTEDLLVGGRQMSVLPIAISMLVTFISANEVIAQPSEVYTSGIQIFFGQLLLVPFVVPITAYFFMTVFYKLRLSSVYEYLELRYESRAVKVVASSLFVLQSTLLSGVALYMGTMSMEALLGIPGPVTALGMGTIATVYTVLGGLKAVVWTDTFQFIFILIGMASILVKGFLKAGGVYQAFSVANQHGRINLFDWTVDPFQRYNTVNIVLGHSMSLLCFFGINQSYAQRYLSLPTMRDAVKAMAGIGILESLLNGFIISMGVAIFAVYAGCDPIGLGEVTKTDQILPYFFVKELSFIPGMIGIFAACIICAVLSTISSVLNSVAAVVWKDFLDRTPYFQELDRIGKGRVTSIIAALCGLATIGLSFLVDRFGSLYRVNLTVFGALSGTIGGVFIMGLLFPVVNKVGALAGLLTSMVVMGTLAMQAYFIDVHYGSLPTNIGSCPADTDFTYANSTVLSNLAREYDWPEKLYTVSYVLYSFIGSSITIVVGLTVSLLSRLWVPAQSSQCHSCLHPLAKRVFSIGRPTESVIERNGHQTNGRTTNLSLRSRPREESRNKRGIPNGYLGTTQL